MDLLIRPGRAAIDISNISWAFCSTLALASAACSASIFACSCAANAACSLSASSLALVCSRAARAASFISVSVRSFSSNIIVPRSPSPEFITVELSVTWTPSFSTSSSRAPKPSSETSASSLGKPRSLRRSSAVSKGLVFNSARSSEVRSAIAAFCSMLCAMFTAPAGAPIIIEAPVTPRANALPALP